MRFQRDFFDSLFGGAGDGVADFLTSRGDLVVKVV